MPLLSPKAVLQGRKSNRAPVTLIIGLIVSGACALTALVVWVQERGTVQVVVGGWVVQGPTLGVGIGIILALPTFAALAGVILLINRLDPEPPINLLFAAGWGFGVAILGAFTVNTTGMHILSHYVGDQAASDATPEIVAPIVEESFKGSLLLLLFLLRLKQPAKYIKNSTDAIVYAGLCALGFAFVENIYYYMGVMSQGDLADTVLLRGVVTPLVHPLFTSMTALGIAYAATHRGARRVPAIIGGWICAVGLHALWNISLSFGMGGMFISYPIDFVMLVLLAVLLVRDRRLLVQEIQTFLPSYVPSGLVQPRDVDMLGSIPARRKARRWARTNAGIVGARAMGDYQLAATELALLHARAANGVVGATQFLTRQTQIVALMRAAQDTFFRRAPQRTAVASPSWAKQPAQSGFFTRPSDPKTMRLPTPRFAADLAPPRGGQRERSLQERPPSGPPPSMPVGLHQIVRPPAGGPPRGPGQNGQGPRP